MMVFQGWCTGGRNVTKSPQMSIHFATSETLDVALDECKIFIKLCQAISSQD
jgi:hypothetical protein